MEYKKLGCSGLDVSPICVGCMGFGDPKRGHPTWGLGEEASRPVIQHALEAGINFFDVANVYSQGTAEEIIGKALKDFTRRESGPCLRQSSLLRCGKAPMRWACLAKPS